MMQPLRVSAARAVAAGWLIAASGGFQPRMALGRRMRLVLLVGPFHLRRLIWIRWGSWGGLNYEIGYRRSLIRRIIFRRLL